MVEKLKEIVLGKRKDPLDPHVFHSMTLVAFFAWVGLGADGLSSSCYGPEEAFLSLGPHMHLALLLTLAVMATVFILSASYSQIIERFPSGGGGYLVASKLLGPIPGLVSGCALLVDYILTIAISVASSMDAIFSFVPGYLHEWRFTAVVICLALLILLNLRGVKESVQVLTPIFLVFVVSHAAIILFGLFHHGAELPLLVKDTLTETRSGIHDIGFWAMALILFRAFALGGGTFTGIEAVSNGIQILREPRVATAKKTMLYMATSLSLTAGGLLVLYLLSHVHAVPGQTLNAVIVEGLTRSWPMGHQLFLLILLSEGALLIVAAQTGFVDGPRVMSNMALDRWLPSRFTSLSRRLVMEDGILLMGLAAMAMIFYTHASVHILIVMYSINVFLTFTLSQLGMVVYWLQNRNGSWMHGLVMNGTGMLLTFGILVMTMVLKFRQGGWVTLAVTGCFIALCALIRRHYDATAETMKEASQILTQIPRLNPARCPAKEEAAPTAVLLVNGYNGIGIHSILSLQRVFQSHFKNIVFVSAGIIDSGRFKGRSEIDALLASVQEDLDRYVHLANRLGFYAEGSSGIGTDAVEELLSLCEKVALRWPRRVFFMGQVAFKSEKPWHGLLHNQTSYEVQRKLLFEGYEAVILPVRLDLSPFSHPIRSPIAAAQII